MIGAIIGDIVGSVYENRDFKSKDFPLFTERSCFTDDTVCTVAIADCLLSGGDFGDHLSSYALRHPKRGYGSRFERWARQWERKPYGSFGNGSAMRVSPIAHFAIDERDALELSEASAVVTHDHPDAVTGAQAVAWSMWALRRGADTREVRRDVERRFGYDLSRSVDEIRPTYGFDISCAGTAPQAITCALEATSFEDAIRNAVSLGGDSDTIACIAGGVAEMVYDVPDCFIRDAKSRLTPSPMTAVEAFER